MDVLDVLGRISFIVIMASVVLFGLASMVGYPGPFVLSSFSLAGLPLWRDFKRGRLYLVLALSAIACILPFWLLAIYTRDGDFTVPALFAQYAVLAMLAYGAGWLGLLVGQVVWNDA